MVKKIEINLDDTERSLVDLLQSGFPLVPGPYAEIGRGLGLHESRTIDLVKSLKERGIVRQIGPVLDAGRMGYRTTLVAMKVEQGRIEEAGKALAAHPMVSHGYERDHELNIWYTLGVPPRGDARTEMEKIAAACGSELFFTLPALKLFKLNAYFGLGKNGHQPPAAAPPETFTRPARLSADDRKVINHLQDDLPLSPTPFAEIAERAGLDADTFLTRCLSLKKRGVIRRFGAAINHRRAGFSANAMTCLAVPPEMAETLGHRLAALPQVSHCYERQTNPAWRYNLFAMVHGKEKEVCQRTAREVAAEAGLTDFVLLYSTREFKKTRVRYTV